MSVILEEQTIGGFNSRTPGGVRLYDNSSSPEVRVFQFTHPGRGATLLHIIASHHHFMFQFTHPGRGATSYLSPLNLSPSSFNSRTPGGVRLYVRQSTNDTISVSIHAPREGCDTSFFGSDVRRSSFNSRTPGGVRLCISTLALSFLKVSIHAPREGCDLAYIFDSALSERFNSRTPGGVRRSSLS